MGNSKSSSSAASTTSNVPNSTTGGGGPVSGNHAGRRNVDVNALSSSLVISSHVPSNPEYQPVHGLRGGANFLKVCGAYTLEGLRQELEIIQSHSTREGRATTTDTRLFGDDDEGDDPEIVPAFFVHVIGLPGTSRSFDQLLVKLGGFRLLLDTFENTFVENQESGRSQLVNVPTGKGNKKKTIQIEAISSTVFLQKFVGHSIPMSFLITDRMFDLLGCAPREKPSTNKKSPITPSRNMGFDAFTRALYLFTTATILERLQFVFAMFDTSDAGFLTRTEFDNVLSEILKAEQEVIFPKSNDLLSDPSQTSEQKPDEPNPGIEKIAKLKAVKDAREILQDATFWSVDDMHDDKLSFEEWCIWAQNDPGIRTFISHLQSSRALQGSLV